MLRWAYIDGGKLTDAISPDVMWDVWEVSLPGQAFEKVCRDMAVCMILSAEKLVRRQEVVPQRVLSLML